MKTPEKKFSNKKSSKQNTKDTNFETNESSSKKLKQRLSVVSIKLKRAKIHELPLFQQCHTSSIFQHAKPHNNLCIQSKPTQIYNPKQFTTNKQNHGFGRYANNQIYTIPIKGKSKTVWANEDKQLFRKYISNVKKVQKIELSMFELSHLLLNLGFIRCMILSRQLVAQLYLDLKGCNILNLYLFLHCLYYHYEPQRDKQKQQLANKILGWFHEYSFDFNQQHIGKEFLNLANSIKLKQYQSLLECYRSRPTCSSQSQIKND